MPMIDDQKTPPLQIFLEDAREHLSGIFENDFLAIELLVPLWMWPW